MAISYITGTAPGESDATGVAFWWFRVTGTAPGDSNAEGLSTITAIYAVQYPAQVLVNWMPPVRTVQYAMLTMGAKPAYDIKGVQLSMLSLTKVAAKQMLATQLVENTLGSADPPMIQASQLVMLTLVRSSPDRRKIRAWKFRMDGHWFYVLHLGDTGTVVFDTTTRKWSEWKTKFYNIWRANYGSNWNEDITAGSVDSNMLFGISPKNNTDYGLEITSIFTAGFPMRMRGSVTCDEVMVSATIGFAPIGAATMQLETSDDMGASWIDQGTLDLNTDNPKLEVAWRSLGEISAPGRIFRLTDSGAAKTVTGIDMFSRDIQEQ